MPVAVTLTLAEAATILDPPLTEAQLREIVHALRWKPAGHRHTGKRGHPTATYPAQDILGLHAALVPFFGNDVR
jgi:hypothetical protein